MRKNPVVWTVAVLMLLAVTPAIGQTVRTRRVMQSKLVASQRVLEALTTSNYTLLASQAQALRRITDSPEWAELKTPEFRGYTDAFIKATQDLVEAAQARDLDAAAARYGPLTMACYNCHRHLKDSRLAR